MNIEFHIEHLILDGLSLSHNQGMDVQAALEVELTRLLEAGTLREGFNMPQQVRGLRSTMPHSQQPEQIGQSVARAVYGQVGEVRE
jgi:hypothetical protein